MSSARAWWTILWLSSLGTLPFWGAGCTEVVELPPEPGGSHVSPATERNAPSPRAEPQADSDHVEVVIDTPRIASPTRDGVVHGLPLRADDRALASDARLTLQGELARYPSRFLKRIGLQRVVICSSLAFDATPCDAFADVEHGRIFIAIRACEDRAALRRTLHHELSHQADFADDQRLDVDPGWEALNPSGFQYAQDAQRYQDDPDAATGPPPPGFYSLYATSSPTEDKAVLYAALVTDRAGTLRRIESDPILRGKADRLRTLLETLGADPDPLIGP
ncbi:MAG: hypothetical protein AB7I30_06370 [Isosphaeraceae bacterium]